MKCAIKVGIVVLLLSAVLSIAVGPAAGEPTSREAVATVTNSIGQTFVLIPAGSFMMGSPLSESERNDDETRHRVTITRSFYMQTTEVTQGQWRAVMGENPSHFQHCGDDCPVENVSWHDAQAFITKLNAKEGTVAYRLPTEAQWEYACRAGTETALYTGPMRMIGSNNAPELDPIAWYGGNSCVEYDGAYDCSRWVDKQEPCSRCGPHPVGLKEPNARGVYDMIGNVWEWCDDQCSYRSGIGVVTDTYRDGVVDPLCRDGADRVYRGGSWYSSAEICRSAYRLIYNPDCKGGYLGFRLVRTQ